MIPDPGIVVIDDALPDPMAYRAQALARGFETIQTGDETWRGIALLDPTSELPRLLADRFDGARTRLTFFRQSPEGQAEPNFIHSDEGMGAWTAILYLTPDPPPEDGTTFWRYKPTGTVDGSARALPKDPGLWTPWRRVEARFNRLLLFPSLLFHSRAIAANYGQGDDARLVQVAFGTWDMTGIRAATELDAGAILAMGQRFVASTSYQPLIAIDPSSLLAFTRGLLASPQAFVWVAEEAGRLTGMIALTLTDHPMSGERIACELAWWMDPDARGLTGVRLYRAAEAWAREKGAVVMQMIAPTDRVGRFYARQGFSPVETAWQKRIS